MLRCIRPVRFPAHLRGTVLWWLSLIHIFFLIFFVFQLYPMIQSLIYSFQEYDGLSAAQYVGLKNYQDLFHADNYAFWDSLKNTAIYWVV